MGYFQHRSTAQVTTHTFTPKSGKGRSLTYRVVFLEPSVEKALTFGRGSRLRFIGEFEGVPLQGAWQSAPGKGHYVMLSAQVLSRAERDVGDEATLAFNVVEADFVAEPDDVVAALATSRRAQRAWAALSPSQKRAELALIESAKVEATRKRRVEKLMTTLMS